MDELEVKRIIRDELSKAKIVFSFQVIEESEYKGLVELLVTRLSLPEKLCETTLEQNRRANTLDKSKISI